MFQAILSCFVAGVGQQRQRHVPWVRPMLEVVGGVHSEPDDVLVERACSLVRVPILLIRVGNGLQSGHAVSLEGLHAG